MQPGMGALLVTMANRARQAGGAPEEGDQTNNNDPEVAGALALANPSVAGLLGDPTTTSQAGGQIAPRKGEAKQSTGNRPAAQLPPDQQPGNPRSRVPPKAQAAYGGIDKEITDHMRAMEDKYKFPRGTMRTIIGFENDGGYDLRKDPNSSAQGWYAFTNQLIDEWKHPRSDRGNVFIMTELAAKNLARNRNALEKATGGKIKLGEDVADIPYYTTLHQWGVVNGPRIVTAMKTNPQVSMRDVMVPNKENGRILMNNGLDPHDSVAGYTAKHYGKIKPWITKAVEAEDAEQKQAQQPQGTPQQGDKPGVVKTTEFNTGAPATGGGDRKHVLGNFRRANGVVKELVAAVKGGAQLALPDGYTVHVTSGHRPDGRTSSKHFDREAIDVQIHGPDGPIANKGGDPTGMYQLLVRGVKTWAQENDQELLKYLGWGAAFETKKGSGTSDEMHIDLGGSRGRLDPSRQFSKLKPLTPEERQKPGTTVAGADSSYQGGEKPAGKPQPSPMFAGGGTEATDVMPKSLPSQGVLGTSDLLGKDNMTRNFKPAAPPNSKQNEAFAGAPPNVNLPPVPSNAPITRGAPPTAPVDAQITRGAPPTAPPDPLAGGTSPEYEGFPTPAIGDQPPAPSPPPVAAIVPQKKGPFGQVFTGPPEPEKPPAWQGPIRNEKLASGQLEEGNIDVAKRPTALLGKPITVTNENGQEILIPTIDEAGKEMTDDEAVQHYAKTGKHLGVFDSAGNASRYGEQLAEAAIDIPSQSVASKPTVPTMKGTVETAAEDAKKRQGDQAVAATQTQAAEGDAKFKQFNDKIREAIVNNVPNLPKDKPTWDSNKQSELQRVLEIARNSVAKVPALPNLKELGAYKPQSGGTPEPLPTPDEVLPPTQSYGTGMDPIGWLTKLLQSTPVDKGPNKVKPVIVKPPDDTAAPANTQTIDIKPVGAPSTTPTAVPYGNVPAMQTGGEYRPATPKQSGKKFINGQAVYWQYGEPEPGATGTPPVDAAPVLEPVEEP
jgi:hypothetical protein